MSSITNTGNDTAKTTVTDTLRTTVTDTLKTTINEAGIATVTLTRADKHNAFDDAIISGLTSTFKRLESDPQVKLMILASEGESFSAGGDLNWMRRMASFTHEENLADAQGLANMLYSLDRFSKPTIARVQGAAFGGAVGLVSCCDIAVGTQHAKFCLSEVKVGLVPATISPYVIAAIGQRAARRFFLTAEVINAQSALELGLLSSLVAPDQLDVEIERFCQALLSNGPQAMQGAKSLIFEIASAPLSEELIAHTSSVIAKARVSAEGQERLANFLNRHKK